MKMLWRHQKSRDTQPTWLVPQTVEGIGFSLADTVRWVTRCALSNALGVVDRASG